MAEKRMFTRKITDSDPFAEMPLSAQALYFHLNLHADDDGFINAPKKISRSIGATEEDLKILIAKRYLLVFDSGVVAVKHWFMHNALKKDRYNKTQYKDERAQLAIKSNKAYTEAHKVSNSETERGQTVSDLETVDGQNVSDLEPQYSIDKNSIDKISIDEYSIGETAPKKHGSFCNVILSDEEFEQLQLKFPADYQKRIENLSSYIASTGKKYDSHYATIINWASKKAETKASGQNKSKSGNPFFDLLNQEGGSLN